MKKISLLLSYCLFTFGIIAQDNFMGDYEEVIETNLSKELMWLNLKKWVSSQFNNYKYVVDLEDKAAGALIIKWNHPFSSPTCNAILPIANATYQIDIKENKYRIKILEGTVKVDPNVNNHLSDLPTKELYLLKRDLEFIMNTSISHFNSSPTWRMDSQYEKVLSNYKLSLDEIPQYKDKKKTKINNKWERKNREMKILNDVKDGYLSINTFLYESLKKAIITTDDF